MKPNLKRLKRLITVLEGVYADPKKRKEFDLEEWAKKTPDCGTHLCAIGWGMCDPVIKKWGLRPAKPIKSLSVDGEELTYPKYGAYVDWAAVQAFFSIDMRMAEHLFSRDAYGSAKSMKPVINRLKSFVKGHEHLSANV